MVISAAQGLSSGGYPSSLRSVVMLVLLMITGVAAYIDLQVFALMVPNLKAQFSLSDTEIGLLQGVAFNLGSALLLFPAGRLIDYRDRTRFLLCICLGWSTFSFLTGFCTSFLGLFLCRMGVGAAEIGLSPVVFSLIADLFPPERRDRGVFAYYAGNLMSVGGAMVFTGAVINALEANATRLPFGLANLPTWRAVFIVSCVPGIVMAGLIVLSRDPGRHVEPGVETAETESLLKFLRQGGWLVPGIIGATTLSFAGFQTLMIWMPAVLNRVYGYSPGEASKALGFSIGIGNTLGVGLAAVAAWWLARRKVANAPLRVLRTGAIASVFAILAIPFSESSRVAIAVWLIANITTWAAHAVGPGLLAAASPNRIRGRVFSIWAFAAIAMSGLSPPIVGLLSDRVFAGAGGLLWACTLVGAGCNVVALLMTTGMGRSTTAITPTATLD